MLRNVNRCPSGRMYEKFTDEKLVENVVHVKDTLLNFRPLKKTSKNQFVLLYSLISIINTKL